MEPDFLASNQLTSSVEREGTIGSLMSRIESGLRDDFFTSASWTFAIILILVFLSTTALFQLIFVFSIGIIIGFSILGDRKFGNFHRSRDNMIKNLKYSAQFDRKVDDLDYTGLKPGSNEDAQISKLGKSSIGTFYKLEISSDLDPALNLMLDLFMRDFISYWYTPLNLSKNLNFENQVRSSLSVALMNAWSYLQNIGDKEISLMIYGMANGFILHSREFRLYEQSGLEWTEFLSISSENLDNHEGKLLFTNRNLSERNFFKRILRVSGTIVDRLLPESESFSPSLRAICREMVCSWTIWPFIDKYSRRKNIFSLILDYFASLNFQKQLHRNNSQSDSSLENPPNADATRDKRNSLKHSNHRNFPASEQDLSIDFVLEDNELFSLFMEYMELIGAPPYLRFWTNVEIFKQFTKMAFSKSDGSSDSMSMQMAKSDAETIFNAHFSQTPTKEEKVKGQDLTIKLVTKSTLGPLSSEISSANEVPRFLDKVNRERVEKLRKKISIYPGPECFDEAKDLVYEILDIEYFEGFKSSKILKDYWTHLSSGQFYSSRPSSNAVQKSEDNASRADNESNINEASENPVKISKNLDSGSENSKSNQNHACNSTDDAVVHLAAAISQLREQNLLIDSQIESLKPSDSKPGLPLNILESSRKMKSLSKQKEKIEREIEVLVKNTEEMMARDSSNETISTEGTFHGADVASNFSNESEIFESPFDLNGAKVNVLDIGFAESGNNNKNNKLNLNNIFSNLNKVAVQNNLMRNLNSISSIVGLTKKPAESTANQSNMAISSAPSGSLMNRLKEMVFLIQVEFPTTTETEEKPNKLSGSLLARSFDDLTNLYNSLKSSFSKVSAIPQPTLTKSTLSSPKSNDERLQKLRDDVELFLRLVVADQLLCESKVTQRFFRSDGENFGNDKPKARTHYSELRQKVNDSSSNITQSSDSSLEFLKGPEKLNSPVKNNDVVAKSHLESSTKHGFKPRDKEAMSPGAENSTHDLTLLIDSMFALVSEIFNLESGNQWLRRRAFLILRQLLLQQSMDMDTSATSIDKSSQNPILKQVDVLVSEMMQGWKEQLKHNQMSETIQSLVDYLWPPPERLWPEWDAESETIDENDDDIINELKYWLSLWLDGSLSSSEGHRGSSAVSSSSAPGYYIYRLMGRSNTDLCISRLIEMSGNRQVMKSLLLGWLEIISNIVLSEDLRRVV